MHKIIQIYTCLLKLSRKQEVWQTDGQTAAITNPLTDIAGEYKLSTQYLNTFIFLLFGPNLTHSIFKYIAQISSVEENFHL